MLRHSKAVSNSSRREGPSRTAPKLTPVAGRSWPFASASARPLYRPLNHFGAADQTASATRFNPLPIL